MIVLIQLFLYMLLNVNSMKGAIRTALVFLLMIGLFRASFIVAENSTDGFVGQRFENILSDPAATFQKERGSNFEVIVPMILEDPFGIGYQRAAIGGKEGTRSMTKNRETQFAALIGDWGLIGMVSMMILFFVFLQKMFKIFKKKNAASYFLAQVFTCYLTSYVIGMIVGPILQANYFVWMLIAMSMNLDQSNQESRSDSERASFSATV